MMSKRRFMIVLFVFCCYMLLGAGIFYHIEHEEEEMFIEVEREERRRLIAIIKKYHQDPSDKKELFDALEKYCGKPIANVPLDVPRKWDFYHALFFVITVVSTIGYGNLAPTTMFSRIFMIFYGLVGIPINGIVMITLGDFFGKSFTKLYNRWKASKQEKKNLDTTRLGLIAQIVLYLVPGFTFCIFVPSIVIMAFEGWEYDVAVYYAFVTLTTIGFGDYVAGVRATDETSFYFLFYQIFLIFWVITGLGYVVMILNFITKGMRSKKLRALEQKITHGFVRTPHRIREELRSVLQEFLLVRVKKVYKEFNYQPGKIERSQSCPDLTIYRNMNSPSMMRKRALSECPTTFILQRIQSDTDLDRIDKDMTFQKTNHQTDLLLKVVDALAVNENPKGEPGCYEGLSDEEILASERYGSTWSFGDTTVDDKKVRRRAISEIRLPPVPKLDDSAQNTWYGQSYQKEIVPTLTRNYKSESIDTELNVSNPSWMQRFRNRFKSKPDGNVDVEKNQELPNGRKGQSVVSNTSRRRPSQLSVSQERVLEETSVADLIRALTVLSQPVLNSDLGETTSRNSAQQKFDKRTRRLPIRSNFQNRRSSLMPSFPSVAAEPASAFHSRRSSFTPLSGSDIFGLLPEKPGSGRRLSLSPVNELPPPPYSPFPFSSVVTPNPSKIRRFSVRPVASGSGQSASPVQRYFNKRDREDSESDKR